MSRWSWFFGCVHWYLYISMLDSQLIITDSEYLVPYLSLRVNEAYKIQWQRILLVFHLVINQLYPTGIITRDTIIFIKGTDFTQHWLPNWCYIQQFWGCWLVQICCLGNAYPVFLVALSVPDKRQVSGQKPDGNRYVYLTWHWRK